MDQKSPTLGQYTLSAGKNGRADNAYRSERAHRESFGDRRESAPQGPPHPKSGYTKFETTDPPVNCCFVLRSNRLQGQSGHPSKGHGVFYRLTSHTAALLQMAIESSAIVVFG
ncbi:hypothetical protein NPIL_314652 [Nephila pilipes]|uniref:Uncharacterized protein n=1 Tax=Nephila pilipes TaxID=299642 RepID=A0A8X6PFL0_NEPPI|nr:hypothetical protein NPIL_314652 [Nephila pilipes]